jgi:hypothetical protein
MPAHEMFARPASMARIGMPLSQSVIPGRAESANPESSNISSLCLSGFRVRRHSASKTRVNALVGRTPE